ncbi:MAG: Gfo/Idh/MocA family protein, partial [Microcystaceae cyanobacterium]
EDALNLGHHVLAEKPLALDPSQCATLTNLAKQKNCQLFIDHTYLFHPAVEKGKELLQSGYLGDLYYGYATRTHLGPVRQDIDVLWDLAIHDVVMFNEWLADKPQQVSARGKIWIQKDKNNPASPNTQGLADTVWVTLVYPNGFEANLHFSWLNPDKQRRLCVVGSQGTLVFNEMVYHEPLSIQRGSLKQQRGKFIPENTYYEPIYLEYREPLREVCDRFLASIENKLEYQAASGKKSTELVNILHHITTSFEKQGELITINY